VKHILIVEPISKRIEIRDRSTVYDALVALNHPIGALCGGKGTCGKCKILSVDTKQVFSLINATERKFLSTQDQTQGIRLACQCKVQGNARILLLEGLLSRGNKILVDSDLNSVKGETKEDFDPVIKLIHLIVPMPNLDHPLDDVSRLEMTIKEVLPQFRVSLKAMGNDLYALTKILPNHLRSHRGEISLSYWIENAALKIQEIEAGHHKNVYGLAIDLGTTTIVGYLINLSSSDIVAISSMLNPQVTIGEDLITRITYIKHHEAKSKAQELIISAFNQIISDVCTKAQIHANQVKELVVVGNTGMHHMLYGLATEQLAVTPFVPVFKAPIYVDASSLGIQASPYARIYSPPVIAGFVGTDTIGCIVSSRIDTYEKFSLLIDIGTNGELVLGNKEGLICGSCAAGSALEGAHIAYGMRAAEGAIESLKIDPDTYISSVSTIGNIKPIGYCGSGLIDLIAEMIKCKMLKRNGNFNRDYLPDHVLKKHKGNWTYTLYDSEIQGDKFSDLRKNFKITVSQNDIRQFQLAKAAFLSGAYLLKNHSSPSRTIEQVLLAGAFGNYIDKENARIIGLFPEIESGRIFQIGNAAGLGAQLCLKSTRLRELANNIAHRVEYFEIASAKDFQKEYAFSMYFPYYKLSRFPSLEEIYHELPLR